MAATQASTQSGKTALSQMHVAECTAPARNYHRGWGERAGGDCPGQRLTAPSCVSLMLSNWML